MVIVAWTRSSSCCSRTTTGQCATTARHRHTQHLMRESHRSNEREIWNEIQWRFHSNIWNFYCIPSVRALSFFFINFHHLFHLFFFAASERERWFMRLISWFSCIQSSAVSSDKGEEKKLENWKLEQTLWFHHRVSAVGTYRDQMFVSELAADDCRGDAKWKIRTF